MKAELLVPITFFIVVLFIVKTVLAYRHKRLVLWHQALTHSLENGQSIEAELMKRVCIAIDPKKHDLKKAILLLCMALFFGLIGVFGSFQDSQGNTVFLVLACIPLGFSALYLSFWKFWYK